MSGQGGSHSGSMEERIRNNQIFLLQAEYCFDSLDHAGVLGHAAAQGYRPLHREAPDDDRLVVTHHGVTEAQQDVGRGNALLLTVDDVGLGKDCAPARQAGDGLGLGHEIGVVLDAESQPGHLILKEGASPARAVLVDRKLRGKFRPQTGEETGALAANLNDGPGFRRQQDHPPVDGGDIPQIGETGTDFQQPLPGAAGKDHRTTADPAVPLEKLPQQPAGRRDRAAPVGGDFGPKQFSRRGEKYQFDGGAPAVQTDSVHTDPPFPLLDSLARERYNMG